MGSADAYSRINLQEEDQHGIDQPQDEDTDDSETSAAGADFLET